MNPCPSLPFVLVIIGLLICCLDTTYSFVPSSSSSYNSCHPSYNKYHSSILCRPWHVVRFIFNSKDFEFSSCIGKGSYLDFQDRAHGLFSTSLLVEGTLIGNVSMEDRDEDDYRNHHQQEEEEDTMIFIEQGGVVQSNLTNVHTVVVKGQIRGSISCVKLIVGSSGNIIGDCIQCCSLQVEPGATIIGMIHCRKQDVMSSPANTPTHHLESKIQEGSITHANSNRSYMKSVEENNVAKLGYTTQQAPLKKVSINTQQGLSSPINNNRQSFPAIGQNGKVLPTSSSHIGLPITTTTTYNHGKGQSTTHKGQVISSQIYKSNSSTSTNFNGIKRDLLTNLPGKKNNPIGGSTNTMKTSSSIPPRFPRDAIPIMLSKMNHEKNHQDASTNVNLDNFGNPLFRGADHQQISSFRHYRELSKDMRNLIDLHQRNLRLKSSTDPATFLSPPSLSSSLDTSKDKKKLLLKRSDGKDESNSQNGDRTNTIPPFLR